MQYVPFLPTLATVITLVYMGILVVRSGKNRLNRVFLTFVAIDSIWLLSVFLVNFTSWGAEPIVARLVFAFSVLLLIALQLFLSQMFTMKVRKIYPIFSYISGLALFVMTACTSWVIRDVKVTDNDPNVVFGSLSPYPVYGKLYGLYLLYFVVVLSVYFFMLYARSRNPNKARAIHHELNIVSVGVGAFALITLLTNLVLPTLFSSSWPSQFAPVGSLTLALAFFYAMSKYRLFDIRLAAIRSTTYAFLLALLAIVYVGSINLVDRLVVTLDSDPAFREICNASVVLLIATSFHPLKLLFDRWTNRYFFRDSYDAQDVIDNLNRTLISSTDIEGMLLACRTLLCDKLKLESVTFALFVPNKAPRTVGAEREGLSAVEYAAVSREITDTDDKILLHDKPFLYHGTLRQVLQKEYISAISKMTLHDDSVGFIVFGPKKNGRPLSRPDIALLSTASDQIALATQNVLRFEEISRFNATLQERVEDATGKLVRTNDKLRQIDQNKDEFISMASHQLRTPLTSIKGYLSMVNEGDVGELNPLQKKFLNQAFISSQRMVYLISDLLNVSRLRTGKFVLEPSELNVANLISEEVKQLRETAKSRGLSLVYERPEHFPALWLDETKIRQVIMNFVDNAIYYTPNGGSVVIQLTDKGQTIEFTVKDSGIGVPKDEQPHLFTKFYRAHNAKRARPDGTGLGLFMAKKVIIAQGGAIIFKSQEGKGSTFGFSFAKAPLLQAPDVLPPPAPKKLA